MVTVTAAHPPGPPVDHADAALIVERIRSYWRKRGWRVFLSDAGRWWATTTRTRTDAIEADTYTELVSKLGRAQ